MNDSISPQYSISADGKNLDLELSLRQLVESNQLKSIDIIIDGTQLRGGKKAPSLLGKGAEFLSQSQSYVLKGFFPQENGSCIARYERA